ncbi:MAG: RHS repeat protein [Pirellulaceae bacterium]|nr:RHS repeat protein [Pirellulaceae bacterium]
MLFWHFAVSIDRFFLATLVNIRRTNQTCRAHCFVCEVLETRSVDADGFTTRSLTDGAGRTLQTIDQLGKISTMTYDAAGNVLSARDPNGVGYDAVYDELGRMTSQTDTFADTTDCGYDDAREVGCVK